MINNGMAKKSYSGKFTPKNLHKYRGDPTKIFWRSLWEYKCMKIFDANPVILEWSSEEIVIPYRSRVDDKIHRYFPDFWLRVKTRNGEIREFLAEVKPYYETLEPVREETEKRKKPTKAYLNNVVKYITNQDKWAAAERYCEQRKWKFIILTEKNAGFL